MVDTYVRGKEIVLKRRDGYAWAPAPASNQGEAYLDSIRFVAVPEDSVRIGALLAGQADGVRNVPTIDEQRVRDSGAQLWAAPLPGIVQQLTVHPGYKNLGDVRVRKAVQFAINRKELVETVLSSTYPVATSVLDQTVPGYVDLSELLPYDPEASNHLLEEAGWTRTGDGIRTKDGEDLVLEVYVAPYFLQSKQLLELVAIYLSNVGIDLKIRSTDIGSYAAYSETSETSFVQTVRASGVPDILYNFFHSDAGALLHSPAEELDQILARFHFATDDDVRNSGIVEAQRHLIEQAYSIPLHEERQTFGLGKDVRGFSTETLARPWFYQVWLDR